MLPQSGCTEPRRYRFSYPRCWFYFCRSDEVECFCDWGTPAGMSLMLLTVRITIFYCTEARHLFFCPSSPSLLSFHPVCEWVRAVPSLSYFILFYTPFWFIFPLSQTRPSNVHQSPQSVHEKPIDWSRYDCLSAYDFGPSLPAGIFPESQQKCDICYHTRLSSGSLSLWNSTEYGCTCNKTQNYGKHSSSKAIPALSHH